MVQRKQKNKSEQNKQESTVLAGAVVSCDVIVVGAGLVGAAFALYLAKQMDVSVVLVERGSRIQDSGKPNQRVSALGQVAIELLRQVQVWDKLPASAYHAYRSMFVWDECSHGELAFKASDYQVDELGYIVDNVACVMALQNALEQQKNIDVRYHYSVDQLSVQDGSAVLVGRNQGEDNDVTLQAKLVVGADGQQSWVRQQLAITAQRFNYEQLGIVATISTQRPHQDTAWQCFLNSGPVAVLPLANGDSSIVWSADQALAQRLMNYDDDQFMDELTQVIGPYVGRVNHVSKRHAFPLQSIKAQNYYVPNAMLIGDAAHGIHPLAGQGANLGFKDAKALVDCLSVNSSKPLDDKRVLRAYERERKLDNETTDYLMTFLYKAFKPMPSWYVGLRGSGMTVLNQTGKLKKHLAKQAIW